MQDHLAHHRQRDAEETRAKGGADDDLGRCDQLKRRLGGGPARKMDGRRQQHRPDQRGCRKPGQLGQQETEDGAAGQQQHVAERQAHERRTRRRTVAGAVALQKLEGERQAQDNGQHARGMGQRDHTRIAAQGAAHQYHLRQAAGHAAEIGRDAVIARDLAEVEEADAAADDAEGKQRGQSNAPGADLLQKLRGKGAAQEHPQHRDHHRAQLWIDGDRQARCGRDSDRKHGPDHPGERQVDEAAQIAADSPHRYRQERAAEARLDRPGGLSRRCARGRFRHVTAPLRQACRQAAGPGPADRGATAADR